MMMPAGPVDVAVVDLFGRGFANVLDFDREIERDAC